VSLRGRLVRALVAVALLALVAADLATYSALRSFLFDRVDQSLAQAAVPLDRGASGGSGPAPAGPSAAGLPPPGTEPSGTLSAAPGLFVEVRNAAGSILSGPVPAYLQGGRQYSPQLPARITGFAASSAAPGQPRVTFDAPATTAAGPEFRVLALQHPDGSQLIVAAPLSDTLATLDHLIWIEAAVGAIALAVAAAVGWWLVRVGLRPLDAVERTAEAIAAGDLDQRVPGAEAKTEVGRLAATLNVMLGRIEGAFAQRDATEAELRRSEEHLRRFVADASHELRTPLAAVSAYAELLQRARSEHPEDTERIVAGIRAETGRMGRLVEDLLVLAGFDEGRPLALAPVELRAVARRSVATASAVGPAWPVSLVDGGEVEVLGDPGRLEQVLDNLLANVRAHTPPGTRVSVTVARDEGEAVIRVADDGPGMEPDAVERAFERFYRADASRSRTTGGSGLGLAIVAAIVGAHGGRVAAASAVGVGTTVTIRLPVAASGALSAAGPAQVRIQPGP
jgi:two-component system, OmpR family, sensor kinase